MPSFKPKQCITLSATDLAALQGDGSPQAIKASLSLTPPFTSSSVVHDNACGAGVVSEIILSSTPPPPAGIQIHATDINPEFVGGTASYMKEKGWPVKTVVMDARELGFADDFFTHSFTAFAFHCMPGGDKATKEIYRTLKPGGTATALTWSDMPHVPIMQEAHWKTRGKDAPMPVYLPCEKPFSKEDLINLLKVGGFKDLETHELHIKIKLENLERWAQLAWSYLAPLAGPDAWLEQDEQKWDEAIEAIVEGMRKNPLCERGENGTFFMGFKGVVAIAKK